MEWSKILVILRWLLTKGDVIPKVIDIYDKVLAVDSVSAGFAVAEELCRLLKEESADLPDLDVFMGEDAAELEASVRADACARRIDIDKLIKIAQIIATLIAMFAKKQQPTT